eukprot:UN01371
MTFVFARWPTQVWISRFMLKYNLSYGSISTSMYSRSAYLFQLQPCLEFTYALRKAFGVPVGVGRILNADEVMCTSIRHLPERGMCRVIMLGNMLKKYAHHLKAIIYFKEICTQKLCMTPLLFHKEYRQGRGRIIENELCWYGIFFESTVE